MELKLNEIYLVVACLNISICVLGYKNVHVTMTSNKIKYIPSEKMFTPFYFMGNSAIKIKRSPCEPNIKIFREERRIVSSDNWNEQFYGKLSESFERIKIKLTTINRAVRVHINDEKVVSRDELSVFSESEWYHFNIEVPDYFFILHYYIRVYINGAMRKELKFINWKSDEFVSFEVFAVGDSAWLINGRHPPCNEEVTSTASTMTVSVTDFTTSFIQTSTESSQMTYSIEKTIKISTADEMPFPAAVTTAVTNNETRIERENSVFNEKWETLKAYLLMYFVPSAIVLFLALLAAFILWRRTNKKRKSENERNNTAVIYTNVQKRTISSQDSINSLYIGIGHSKDTRGLTKTLSRESNNSLYEEIREKGII